MSKRGKTQFWMEFLSDLACLIVANAVSFTVFHYIYAKIIDYPSNEWFQFFFVMLVAYVIVFTGFYSRLDIAKRNRSHEIMSLVRNATLTYLMFLAFLVLLKCQVLESRYMILSGYMIYILLLLPERYILKRWITGFFTHSKTASLVGIITTSDIAEEFVKGIKQDWTLSISGIVIADNIFESAKVPVGAGGAAVVQNNSFPKEICDIPVVSTDETFMDWVRSSPLDEIFISVDYLGNENIQELIEELEDMGIVVHLNMPRLHKMLEDSKFDNINCRIYAGYPLATFSAAKHNTTLLVIKRIFDVVASIIGCIIALIAMALVAIPLKKDSPGPLIFKQQRIGKNGRPFNIYKIRSMYADAEERKSELEDGNKMDGHMFKIQDDPRITKVGKVLRKYSIDELPQFFNVLKGDMSLVGTRPPTIDEFKKYESRHKRRLSMRPGITGMWQVSGRSQITDFEEVVELDCKYIDEWSIELDIRILLKTVVVVLTHKGAE